MSRPQLPFTAALILTLAGCGVPPELEPRPGVSPPSPTAAPTSTRPSFPLPSSSAASPVVGPSFAENYAVACLGQPSADQVVAMLRAKSKLLPKSGTINAPTGPLCAGTWQYTILAVPGREPLHVVTEGRPNALRLITAGTNICSVEVRTHAPAGIVAAARC